MIKRIFNKGILNSRPFESVAAAAFVITTAGMASRVLGLLRDRFLAGTFGAGDTLDVYYAAFRIPDLIYNLLILGALSAAFIPVFTGLISRDELARPGDGKNEAWKVANGILNLSIFFIIILSIILAILAPWIMKILTPGFSAEKMEMTVSFTRIMFLSPLFLGISGIFGGILTSFKSFLIYAIAPIMYNVGIIIGILALVPIFGPMGLAWGVVLGALMHMLIQYPAARHLGFKHQGILFGAFKNNAIMKIFRLMFPRMMGIAVNQISFLIITVFASTLAAGSLAIFNFAFNLQSVPLGLIGASFSIAVFPVLSAYAARGEKENFVRAFSETFRQILFFVIPISIFTLVLRAQLVRVVLGAGEFDWTDTILTFQCLGIFALSLFAQCAVQLLARAFYALQDTKTPFYIALATESVNILAMFILVGRFQILGLVMAFSIASVAQMFLLLFILRTRFENLDDKNIIKSIVKIGLASFAAGVGIQLAKYGTEFIIDLDTFLGVFTQLAASSVVGLLIFIAICHILKLEEFLRFKNALTRRLFKSEQAIIESTDEVSGI